MSIDSVYVVILNWNRCQDTLDCLKSVLAMQPKAARVILVDNASSDGTPQTVAERFPQVRLLLNQTNLGFAGGMNVGIRAALEAGAEYLLLLNNDTVVAPDLLGRLLAVAAESDQVGIVAPKIYFAEPSDRIWFAGAMRRRWFPGFSFPGYGQPDAPRYNQRREVDYATGCGMLVPSRILHEIGLFDECTFFMYHEDLDLSERVRRAGYRIVYEPQARMWHRESASTAPLSPVKWYYMARYIVPFFRRYYRWPLAATLLYTAYVILREMWKHRPELVVPYLRGISDGLNTTGKSRP